MQAPRLIFFGAAVLAFGLGARKAAAQCSMCRTGLLHSPEGQQLAAGFNSGILFLLAVPVILFCSALFFYWRASRNRFHPAERTIPPASEKRVSAPSEMSEPA